jgi:enamine deaminase RidA (YjgF/YER057c/UK114 family)
VSRAVLQPPGWLRPLGYANGIAAAGRTIFTAGLIGWDEAGHFADGLTAQCTQVFANILAVLEEGGARPEHIVRLTWYITSRDAYLAEARAIGAAYRAAFGKQYPAMAVVQVSALMERQALVEIEATAVVPG